MIYIFIAIIIVLILIMINTKHLVHLIMTNTHIKGHVVNVWSFKHAKQIYNMFEENLQYLYIDTYFKDSILSKVESFDKRIVHVAEYHADMISVGCIQYRFVNPFAFYYFVFMIRNLRNDIYNQATHTLVYEKSDNKTEKIIIPNNFNENAFAFRILYKKVKR